MRGSKVFNQNQITAITNSFANYVNQDLKRIALIRNVKESRISEDEFKELLMKITFPMTNPERFACLCQVFMSSAQKKAEEAAK